MENIQGYGRTENAQNQDLTPGLLNYSYSLRFPYKKKGTIWQYDYLVNELINVDKPSP